MKYLFLFINALGYFCALVCGIVILSYYFAPDELFKAMQAHDLRIQGPAFFAFFGWLALKPLHTIADGMGRYLDQCNQADEEGTSYPSIIKFTLSTIWKQHLWWRMPLVLILLMLMLGTSDKILNY